jgi:hypothetical protein
VQISADCFPYEYYDLNRFLPIDLLVHHGREEEVIEADLELI